MNSMKQAAAWMIVFAAAALSGAAPATGPAAQVAVIEAVEPSLCRIEYTFQYDKGEAPTPVTWIDRCPTCGSTHGSNTEGVLEEERPLELPGIVLSPTRVFSPDLMVHPRFIKGIAVRAGGELAPAKVVGIFKAQPGLLLELATPLAKAKPMRFDPAAKGPYYLVKHSELNAQWTISVRPASESAAHRDESGRTYRTAAIDNIVVDKSGTGVGVILGEQLPLDDSWKKSPADWGMIKADEMTRLLAGCEQRAGKGILRVSLSFRSPKAKAGQEYYDRDSSDDRSTEKNVLGVLIDERTALVLSNLAPSVTARLERIVVRPEGAKGVAATFAGTVEDYGCFFAKLERPLSGAVVCNSRKVTELRDALLLCADVQLQGEQRIAYYDYRRVVGYSLGWKRLVRMFVNGAGPNAFLYDLDGKLVGLPLSRRPKVNNERDYDARNASFTPVAHLAGILADPAKHIDKNNVPLSETDENRIAWMGVELQPLNRDLAQANGVSDLTFDGASGALITFVYPGSPAAKAGMETGDILLRLHLPGEPRPVDVRAEPYVFAEQPFPWDRLASCPEEYFERLPQPWQPIESRLTRTLTDLGLGKPYTVEFFHGGKAVKKELAVTACPTYFATAAKHKDERLGVTVREMTFEVRRYFQRKDDEPGVILSKIEIGGRASKAGLRPFEVITHVNDKPVRSAEQFRALVDGQTDLRLEIKQLTKGRLVKVKLDAPATAPTTRLSGAE